MSMDGRLEYVKAMKDRYEEADRKGKAALLTAMVEGTGYSRKHLTYRLNGSLRRKRRKGGRGCKYGAKIGDALRVLSTGDLSGGRSWRMLAPLQR